MTAIYSAATSRPTTRVLFVIVLFIAAAWYVLRSNAPAALPALTVAEPDVSRVTPANSQSAFTISLPNDDGGETAVTYTIVASANGLTTLRSEIGRDLVMPTNALGSDNFLSAIEQIRTVNAAAMLARYGCENATVKEMGGWQKVSGCRGN